MPTSQFLFISYTGTRVCNNCTLNVTGNCEVTWDIPVARKPELRQIEAKICEAEDLDSCVILHFRRFESPE